MSRVDIILWALRIPLIIGAGGLAFGALTVEGISLGNRVSVLVLSACAVLVTLPWGRDSD